MKAWLAVAALFAATQAWGNADIEGNVDLPNGSFIGPGSFATIRLTIKNNGPDATQTSGMGTVYFGTVGFRTIELVASPATPPCIVQYTVFIPPPVPPRPATVGASVLPLRGLAPGESFTCVVAIGTYPEAAASFGVRISFASEQADPNPGNNEVLVNIRTRAEVVAVPTLSWAGLTVLLIGCGFIGMARFRARTWTAID